MSRQRRRPPQVESLEGKLLLSAAQPATTPANGHFILDGNYSSSVKAVHSSTVSNTLTISEAFAGSSRSTGRATGTLSETGNSSTSTLTSAGFLVQNARGSIHLTFGNNDLVSQSTTKTTNKQILLYTVDYGTGVYAGATGGGLFTMTYFIKSGAVKGELAHDLNPAAAEPTNGARREFCPSGRERPFGTVRNLALGRYAALSKRTVAGP